MIKLIIISGRSGSGKSAALQALEDLGYYCIDNLPAALLPQLAEHFEQLNLHSKVAICIDARNPTSELAKFNQTIEGLNNRSYDISILYLDAHDDILLQRYSSTRRRHPLTSENMSLVEAIDLENTLLAPISKQATLNIDTTGMAVQMLRQVVQQQAAQQKVQNISLLIESFGFKHGLPKDADFVFDVRCLPNPYWQPELRAFTGRDQQIQDYLSAVSSPRTFSDGLTFALFFTSATTWSCTLLPGMQCTLLLCS